jgi:hypothetical protein
MTGRIDARLTELGLTLPPAGPALFSYQPVVIAKEFAFVAGQPPVLGSERPFLGRVGAELTLEQGQAAVRLSCAYGAARGAAAGGRERVLLRGRRGGGGLRRRHHEEPRRAWTGATNEDSQ